MRFFTAAFLACVVLATTVSAKPPLREVKEIDDMVMVVAIADEIRKSCDGIGARLMRAYSTLNELKSLARDKGYTEDEVEDYVTSKTEKQRMRAKAERFLAGNGVNAGDKTALCSFGKRQMQSQTEIGRLLK
jgi:hypothetical protein